MGCEFSSSTKVLSPVCILEICLKIMWKHVKSPACFALTSRCQKVDETLVTASCVSLVPCCGQKKNKTEKCLPILHHNADDVLYDIFGSLSSFRENKSSVSAGASPIM